ncbi:MAG: hypothetical protein IJ678_05565, partial [Kiritimatiellae bacterium]|nr:hypothetical protein [Kiritimatiellia bacterium]
LRAAGAPEEPEPRIVDPDDGPRSPSAHGMEFGQTPLGKFPWSRVRKSGDRQSDDETAVTWKKLSAVLVPDDLLGRDVERFRTATVWFLLLFALAVAAVLATFFAARRGEARMPVWKALPALSLAAAAVGLWVVPLALDTEPRSDVTEWRFGVSGLPEAYSVAKGRENAIDAKSAVWNTRAGTWVAPVDSYWDFPGVAGRGISVETDGATGASATTGPRRDRGRTKTATARRFIPNEKPFSVSPDPDAVPADFFWAETGGTAPSPEAADSFAKLLEDWTHGTCGPMGKVRTPRREITANMDFSAVWVFARGQWYALGPMQAGTTVALDASMRFDKGLSKSDALKRFENVFARAPFAIDLSGIVPWAKFYLGGSGGSDGDSAADRPKKVPKGSIDMLDDVLAIGLAAPDAPCTGPGPALEASFPFARKPHETTGRVVYVEVLQ